MFLQLLHLFVFETDSQDTPSTKIRQFHITTPRNIDHQSETTPRKPNYFATHYDSGSRGSNKKNRSKNSIRWSSPKQGRSQKRTSSFASIEEDSICMGKENSNICNQSIEYSPIKPHNTSNNMVSALPMSQVIQRHPSGIEASTPKTYRRTQSSIKPKVSDAISNRLRKVQSYSPRTALRENPINCQSSFGPDDMLLEDHDQQIQKQDMNPIRKILDLDENNFEKLTNLNKGNLETPTKSSHEIGVLNKSASKKSKCTLERLETQTGRAKDFRRMKTFKPATPSKSRTIFNASDISASFKNVKETNSTNSNVTDELLMDISDPAISVIKTPNTNCSLKNVIISDTPIRNNYVDHNVRGSANRTPTKHFEKSYSFNFLSVKSSSEKEKNDIIHSRLPCTPPKNRHGRSLKRSAADLTKNEPSAKRKLYEKNDDGGVTTKPARKCLYGLEKVNILTQLEKCNVDHIMETILSYLTDEALNDAYHVCKSWKRIIDNSKRVSARLRKYVKTMQTNKENARDREKPTIHNNNNVQPLHNVKPFHPCNQNSQLEKRPMIISPSKRRFNRNLKVQFQTFLLFLNQLTIFPFLNTMFQIFLEKTIDSREFTSRPTS